MMMCFIVSAVLFLTHKDVDGCSRKRPVVAQFIFQETLIGLFHILWQVGVEHEGWNLRIGHLRQMQIVEW